MSSPVALSVLWCVLVGRSDALHTGMLLPRATSPRLSSPLSMMATDTEGETAAGGEVAPAPVDPNAPVDLSAMTFEERLAYLSAQAPNEVPNVGVSDAGAPTASASLASLATAMSWGCRVAGLRFCGKQVFWITSGICCFASVAALSGEELERR